MKRRPRLGDPDEDLRVEMALRQAKQGWTTLLALSLAKDRLHAHGEDLAGIDAELAAADSLIEECEVRLAALDYVPTYREAPAFPPARESARRRRRPDRRQLEVVYV